MAQAEILPGFDAAKHVFHKHSAVSEARTVFFEQFQLV